MEDKKYYRDGVGNRTNYKQEVSLRARMPLFTVPQKHFYQLRVLAGALLFAPKPLGVVVERKGRFEIFEIKRCDHLMPQTWNVPKTKGDDEQQVCPGTWNAFGISVGPVTGRGLVVAVVVLGSAAVEAVSVRHKLELAFKCKVFPLRGPRARAAREAVGMEFGVPGNKLHWTKPTENFEELTQPHRLVSSHLLKITSPVCPVQK
jgi:hypothetical protein